MVKLPTAFAPAERVAHEEVLAQFNSFVGTHCQAFFDALPSILFALNKQRQVVFANLAAIKFLGFETLGEVLGMRPGEALNCLSALDSPAGCGTSRHCRNCMAAQVILRAIDGLAAEGECTLLRRQQNNIEGLDLLVNASPITVKGEPFLIFAMSDNSHEQRRRSMERIFFHDVLNLAGGISGLAEHLLESCTCAHKEELEVLSGASNTLVDEIVAQRELLAAETSELEPEFSPVPTGKLLQQLQVLYASSPLAQGQKIRVDTNVCDVQILTDGHLVQRVLGNMLKNALEAGTSGDCVLLSCFDEDRHVVFKVWSRPVIESKLQENIFRRRFSTKGEARGLGTYSMILLAERYLKGSVGFTSAEPDGTTFFLRLPKCLEKA